MKKLATALLSFGLMCLAVGIISAFLIRGDNPDLTERELKCVYANTLELINLYTGLGIGWSMVSFLYLMIGIEQDKETKRNR